VLESAENGVKESLLMGDSWAGDQIEKSAFCLQTHSLFALMAALQLAVAMVYAAYLRVEGTPEKVGLVCILQEGLGVMAVAAPSFS
jgi:hypothetical protein